MITPQVLLDRLMQVNVMIIIIHDDDISLQNDQVEVKLEFMNLNLNYVICK